MKRWSASNSQSGHSEEARSKALVRKLRDWLNGFLGEPRDSVVGESQTSGDAPAAPAILSTRDRKTHGPLPTSVSEEQIGAPAWSALNPPGPPEDWLRRVREGAPGLLLPAEEGGTPSFRAPGAPIGESQPQQEMTSTPAAPVRSPEALSDFEERRAARVHTSPPRLASGKNEWMPHLKRHVIHLFARLAEKEKSRRQKHSATEPQAEHERQVALARERPEFVGEVRPPQTPQEAAVESRHPVGSEIRAATVALRWTERVKQRIQEAVQTASANRSTSMAPAEPEKVQRANPPTAAAVLKETRAAAGQVGTKVDRGPSQPAVTSRAFERSSKRQPWPVMDVPASTISSRTWMPLPARAQDLAKRTRESAGTGNECEQEATRIDDARAIQPADQWTLASGHSSRSERDDPWPELPEVQSRSIAESTQFLRNTERLRALDLEQRGGR